jgi:endonuclease/exonuclease/phosphatase family metal-dependent hydrolase
MYDESLPESTYDLWVYLRHGMNMARRFTEAKVFFKPAKKNIYVYNTHLTHLSFAELRLAQIHKVFEYMDNDISKKAPVIITGDLNLYNGKTELEKLLEKYDLQEATSNLAYTFQHRVLFWTWKAKLDYIMFRNLDIVGTRRYDKGLSDHHPILTEFEL